jgi:hypothetical protein
MGGRGRWRVQIGRRGMRSCRLFELRSIYLAYDWNNGWKVCRGNCFLWIESRSDENMMNVPKPDCFRVSVCTVQQCSLPLSAEEWIMARFRGAKAADSTHWSLPVCQCICTSIARQLATLPPPQARENASFQPARKYPGIATETTALCSFLLPDEKAICRILLAKPLPTQKAWPWIHLPLTINLIR